MAKLEEPPERSGRYSMNVGDTGKGGGRECFRGEKMRDEEEERGWEWTRREWATGRGD